MAKRRYYRRRMRSRLWRESIFVVAIAWLLFHAVAVLTYHPLDPGFNVDSEFPATNSFGRLGAYYSSWLVFHLGVGALLLLFPGSLLTVMISGGGSWSLLIGSVFLAISGVLLLGAVSPLIVISGVEVNSAGLWGLKSLAWFQQEMHLLGVALLITTLAWLGALLVFRLPITSWLSALVKGAAKLLRRRSPAVARRQVSSADGIVLKLPDGLWQRCAKSAPPPQGVLNERRDRILSFLGEFGVKGTIAGWHVGPKLLSFFFKPDRGVRQSQIFGLATDLALALGVPSVGVSLRSERSAVAIQVPRREAVVVRMGDLLGFLYQGGRVHVTLGVSAEGEVIREPLDQLPHLLVAGTTGSGKTVSLCSMLMTLAVENSPETLRMILIDPKVSELTLFSKIPHLLIPTCTDIPQAIAVLAWLIEEMERRYQQFADEGVSHLEDFNLLARASQELKPLPKIVVIIDEFADMMLGAKRRVEAQIQKLTQKARASGIHLIIGTQRPSVDVITGVIKANLPCRLSYQVVSRHDSITIIGQPGAERLLGKGDFLFLKPGRMIPLRGHSPFADLDEIKRTVSFLGKTTRYDRELVAWIEQAGTFADVSRPT